MIGKLDSFIDSLKKDSKYPIQFEELAKCSGADKYMFKCYLDAQLISKKWEDINAYSTGSTIFPDSFRKVKSKITKSYKLLVDLIDTALKEKQVSLENTSVAYFWKGKEVEREKQLKSGKWVENKIDTMVETTVKKTYYLNGKWKKRKKEKGE